MARYDRKCPSCGKLIHPHQVPLWQSKGFPCPWCGVRLHGALWQVRLTWLLSFVSALLVSISLGIHGWFSILLTLIGTPAAFILIQMLAVFTTAPGLNRFPEDRNG
jgi:hypothetical protein